MSLLATMPRMNTPAFFDDIPPIVVTDPLAAALGAAADGVIEYRYLDAVKLAGHSCPTVLGAWLTTRAALARLYGDELPQRGEIRVELHKRLDEGVAGVVGAVAGLVTGAANEGGFHGLAGRFSRRGLLHFGVPMTGEIRFTRLDSGRAVEAAQWAHGVPRPEGFAEKLQAASRPNASSEARQDFADMWQGWVRDIAADYAAKPAQIQVEG